MKRFNVRFLRSSLFAHACFLLVCGIFGSTGAQAAVLYSLSSTVLDGGAGENTYFVSNASASGTGAGLAYNSGTPSLLWTQGSTNNQYTFMLAYLGSSAVLTNTGDSVTLSYAITPSGPGAFSSSTDGSFRLGLFNSNGSKITGDQTGTGSGTFSNYGGYLAYYRPNGSTTASDSFYQRTTGSSVLPTSNGSPALTPTLVSPGTGAITGSLTITKLALGVQLDSVINGGAVQSITDTTSVVTTFDTLSFLSFGGPSNATLYFTELSVTTVPEPSSWALMGMGGVAVLCFRRRKP
jgi:hypothetical protein